MAAESNSTYQTPIPPEIILEILYRLPVKPLLRFRCVCKSWCSLISDPQFAKTHLSLASRNTDYAHHRLILRSGGHSFEFKTCSLYCILYEQSDTAIELDYPSKESKEPHQSVWIRGYCDGLVCVAIERNIVFLWNPSIKKSKRLPSADMPEHCVFALYGFGYAESRGDYKVVGIFVLRGSSGVEAEVHVYRLRTDSWRRIGDSPHGTPYSADLGFVNGALHWIANGDSNSSFSGIIVSLDLAEDTYGEVSQPDYRDGEFDAALGVLSGCLCILCNYEGGRADVWVMKEYGTRESWTKLVVIPVDPSNYMYSTPLCILKNGEVLLGIQSSHLVRYNPKDGTFRHPTIHNSFACFNAHPYIESLVWPDADVYADSLV